MWPFKLKAQLYHRWWGSSNSRLTVMFWKKIHHLLEVVILNIT